MSVSISGIVPVAMPAFPAVLPFPGVPPLAVGFGASLGLPGGAIAGGFSAGPGGVSGGLSGGLGPVSGNINFGPGGVSGGASVGIPGIGGGSISITPEGITGNVGVGIGGLSANLTGSLTGGVNPFGLSMISSLPPLLTQDQPGSLFQGPRWGIFDSTGKPVGSWDTVVKVDYRHEMKIADFPIEAGAFASYNKVQVPYDIRISFAIGSGAGGANRRTKLLSDLEQAVGSLAFYTVATPEATYAQANLTHLEYSRTTDRGVNLLVCDVWVSEVRPAAGATFTNANPQAPTSQAATNNGPTQAKDAPPDDPSLGPTLDQAAQMQGQPTPVFQDPTAPQMMLSPMPTLGSDATSTPPPANMPSSTAPINPGLLTDTPATVVPSAPTPDPTALY